MDCLFCRVVKRELPASVVYEDKDTVVIRDINPQAPTHLLAIPKKHFGAVHEVPPSEAGFFDDLYRTVAAVVRGGEGIEFCGSSFLCDPQGVVLAEAPADREEILLGEVDLGRIRGRAAELALPARPPDRRLRGDHAPFHRRRARGERALTGAETPASLGFRIPAEWEPHEATWIGWPRNRSDWPGKFPVIPWVYGEIVRKIAAGETVRILVESAAREAGARRVLSRAGADVSRVEFFRFPTDRGWTRDFGPIFVRRDAPKPEVAVVGFRFNAWARYTDWRKDAKIPERVAKSINIEPPKSSRM